MNLKEAVACTASVFLCANFPKIQELVVDNVIGLNVSHRFDGSSDFDLTLYETSFAQLNLFHKKLEMQQAKREFLLSMQESQMQVSQIELGSLESNVFKSGANIREKSILQKENLENLIVASIELSKIKDQASKLLASVEEARDKLGKETLVFSQNEENLKALQDLAKNLEETIIPESIKESERQKDEIIRLVLHLLCETPTIDYSKSMTIETMDVETFSKIARQYVDDEITIEQFNQTIIDEYRKEQFNKMPKQTKPTSNSSSEPRGPRERAQSAGPKCDIGTECKD
jgi:hypothetical protein